MPLGQTLLGFDFGIKRIGVAIGSTEVGIANPLMTIEVEDNKRRFEAIEKLMTEWTPDAFVVGLPVHADGTEHEMTIRCRRFSRQLEGRFQVPVHLVDERFTSLIAEDLLKDLPERDRRKKGDIDAVAAQIILQSYLDNFFRGEITPKEV